MSVGVGSRSDGRGRVFLLIAAVLGTLHALPSIWWAAGSEFLLSTVGTSAVEAARAMPGGVTLLLSVVATVKLAAAWIPVLAERGLPWRRFWRALSWLGGAGLVVYGVSGIIPSAAVLLGWIVPDGPVDRAALLGHALLWDPLFALWGATLLIGLWRSRRGARSLHRDTVDEPR
ncbi:DUF3995 domain-containing protein [Pseudoclavibacter chungangensis]|uniref:DUF3995 domain-containing protein n=1 Tax=Pseudoclavibacter chungangensis TaxID=587635 RepID=A0A7J5BRD8_9MICO|nr:DUF3995 domain-containing protein [Pseudoclavibacter chungangensis]KAB1656305.1 DUF3995 domain-containing protein [Pseudoclavibacter chungangensis]NYJ67069.1 hypothetical protein [Pseudoclavibacter chungangensis]